MELIEITPQDFDVDIALAYATAENFTGAPVYRHAVCYLHRAAAEALHRTIEAASALGYRLRIFDALRPTEAQWMSDPAHKPGTDLGPVTPKAKRCGPSV